MFDKIISEETRNNIAKRRENNIKTLFGLPYKQDIDGEDFVVLGVPYDTSVTNRTGCRFGPRAIRNAYGAGRLSYEQDNSYKVANLKGMDMGDIGVVLGYVEETMELIRNRSERYLTQVQCLSFWAAITLLRMLNLKLTVKSMARSQWCISIPTKILGIMATG